MAFVFKAERPCLETIKSPFPGPGQYSIDEKAPIDPNPVPFLTTSQRAPVTKKESGLTPGPGTYIAPVSVQGYNTKTKTLYSSLNPEMPALVEQKTTVNFNSASSRFPKNKEAEQPGPGTYELPTAIQIKGMAQTGFAMSQNLRSKDSRERKDEKQSKSAMMKAAVPSIPSVIHSYGYTEDDARALTLNNNPLLEIQKFVGPGYYDVPAANNYRNPKGINWARSNGPRGFNPDFAVSTGNIGPGSYKPKKKVYIPLYKFKPSAAFSSKITRAKTDKERLIEQKKAKQALRKTDTNLLENPDEIDSEFDSGTTPGPGYYHNHTAHSAFKHKYNRPSHQFFGSGGERFEDSMGAKVTVGPGRYNLRKEFGKKFENDVNVPFNTQLKRFNGEKNDNPGPGTYENATTTEVKVVVSENFVENFGTTESRFKQELKNITPGPGAYHKHKAGKSASKDADEKDSKNSHMFTSSSKREAIKIAANTPAPGAYNVGQSDLSAKSKKIEDEDIELSLKRAPFGSNVERFKRASAQIDEDNDGEDDDDDSFDEGWNVDGPDRGDLILKARKQPKMSSAFASKSNRSNPVSTTKNFIPGPGKYNAGTPDDWVKKTYNVNFTAD